MTAVPSLTCFAKSAVNGSLVGGWKMIGQTWKNSQASLMNFAPRWRRRDLAPIDRGTFRSEVHTVAYNDMRGRRAPDIVENRRYLDGLSLSIEHHLTGRFADIGSLAGIQLHRSNEGINPSTDDG